MSKDKFMAFMKTFFRILLYIVLFALVLVLMWFRWYDREHFFYMIHLGRNIKHQILFASEMIIAISAVIAVMNIENLKRVRWFRNTMIAIFAIALIGWFVAPTAEYLYSKHEAERLFKVLDKYGLLHEGNRFAIEEVAEARSNIADEDFKEMNDAYMYLCLWGDRSVLSAVCLDCDNICPCRRNIDGSPNMGG